MLGLTNKNRKNNKGYLNWFFAAVAFTLLWGITLVAVERNFSQEREQVLSNDIDLITDSINSILKAYELFSNFIFSEIINQPEVLNLIAQAGSADENEKDALRMELYQLLEDDYKEMENYNFRQLHFHLPMGESFMRFHSPQDYGDSLYDARETIRIVNDERRFVSGFEEGRIFNGYRFMYPIFYHDAFIGSVEVSISMATVTSTLSELHHQMDFYFIMKKKVVDAILWNEKLINYEPSFWSEDYYFDKQVYEQSLAANDLLSASDIKSILNQSRNRIPDLLRREESFSIVEDYNGDYYQITFFSLRDVSNLHAGYVISVKKNENLRLINQARTYIYILYILVYLIFQTALILLMRDRIRIKEQADHDSLTNLPNRQKFEEIALAEILRSYRYEHDLCLFLLDIDFFKQINDQYGHAAGDQVLIKISRLVVSNLRANDTFSRWGGDEFVCLLPETSLDKGVQVSEKIQKVIAGYDFGLKSNVTVSIGIAELARHGHIDKLLNAADDALYKAKSMGGNRVYYDDRHSTE